MPKWIAICSLVSLVACEPYGAPQQIPRVAQYQADKIRFQDIVIQFKDIQPTHTRTKKEAEALAQKLYQDLQKRPSQFGEARKQYSDDPRPKAFQVVNFAHEATPNELKREDISEGLAEVLFQMKVGDIALVPYHAEKNPVGFQIIMALPIE